MAATVYSAPFQSYVYQSAGEAITPFQIIGGEPQIVQIMVKSQEKITAKPGTMCYMSGSIQMDNTLFRGLGGIAWQWFLGKIVTSIVLTNGGTQDGYVGIAAPYPGRIIPIDLVNFGGEILMQPNAFLCSINDVMIKSAVDLRARNAISDSELYLKQKLVGQGLAFLCGSGSVVQKILQCGEVVVVDVVCIVAMTSTVDFQIHNTIPFRRAIFGGQHQITASLTGPGVVFIQSLPFHRLSQQIARAAAPPALRENPKLYIQIAIFLLLSYFMIASLLLFLLTDIQ